MNTINASVEAMLRGDTVWTPLESQPGITLRDLEKKYKEYGFKAKYIAKELLIINPITEDVEVVYRSR